MALPARGEGEWQPSFQEKSQLSHHVATKTIDDSLAGERHELDVAGLPRLEPHRGAGGDIEPHAARLFAVEFQRRIGFEEMIVRADLDRAVAGVGDVKRHGLAAGVEFDLAVLDEEFTGDHSEYLPNCCCVMAGLVPAIHALLRVKKEDVDARHKAGHDELERSTIVIGSAHAP